MTDKMPVAGSRYRLIIDRNMIIEVKFIYEPTDQIVYTTKSCGLVIEKLSTFFDYFQELPKEHPVRIEEMSDKDKILNLIRKTAFLEIRLKMLEGKAATKSIWKPVSELPEDKFIDILVKYKSGEIGKCQNL